jgi:hypothetical protein
MNQKPAGPLLTLDRRTMTKGGRHVEIVESGDDGLVAASTGRPEVCVGPTRIDDAA